MSFIINPFGFGLTPASAFFVSDPMTSSGWGQVTYPAAIYVSSTNTTYVTWQFVGLSGHKGMRIAAYSHATNSWGERATVGNFLLADDDHGLGVLIRDASGYIHCFFGCHSTTMGWSVTNNPDDITSWTQQTGVGTSVSYPAPVLIGSTIYVFVRQDATSSRRTEGYATLTPSSGVGTFSAFTTIIDFDPDSRVYRSECHAVGTDIHFVCTRANELDTTRKGVYYFILDTTTGAVKNYNGTVTVASGSLPVTMTQANASFRIYDHGSNDGDLASFQFDTSGNAHLIFAAGTSPTYDLKHMYLSGGSWSSPANIATIPDSATGSSGFVSNYTLVQGASGRMEAWYNNSAGDKLRRVWNGSSWDPQATVQPVGTLKLLQGNAVKNATANFRTLYAENSGTTLDSGAVPLSLFAYGDSGPVTGSVNVSASDSLWSNVTLLLGANHRNNATRFVDESPSAIIVVPSGNAKVDTTQSPFAGRASIKLDGTGDYLTTLTSSAYSASGTSDFCIDMYVRLNELGRLQCLMSKRVNVSATGEYALYISAANKINMLMFNGSTAVLNLTGTTTLTTGVWYHVEASRISSVTYLFVAGVLEASGTQSAAPSANTSQTMIIGRDVTNVARDFNGWLADVRFTRAGRHSSGFTPPTTPFPRR